ncbi:hypothetical protein BJV82DRAFT_601934 [Fennellomyces sp. T-0311]|nr:hypothetical protein BJV82DRAFT_601934 [Fennellomyces sp. T-0311]
MSQPSPIVYPYINILMGSHVSCPPIVEELFGNGKHAFERSQFPEALKCFTKTLKTIDSHLRASALLGRAMCREMQGNMSRALVDAKTVVELSPTWSGGYMYLSRLYSIQGDYAQVLLTLQTGVEKSSTKDPRYEELVYQFASMEAQVKRRNCSLIDRLPVESLINIFSHLDFESRVQSASTCRYWRLFLLERFPFMWINIHLQKSHWVLKNITSWHSVRMVRISCPDAEEALQILAKKNIRGIQVLELHGCNLDAVSLFKMLSLNRHSLQTLTLVATNIKPNILLGTVFDTLPNLAHFTCTGQAIKSPPWSEKLMDCFDSIAHHDQQHDSNYSSQPKTNSQSGADSQQEASSQRSTTVPDFSLTQLHVGSGAAPNLISRVLRRSPSLKTLTLHEVGKETLESLSSVRSLDTLCLHLEESTATVNETYRYDTKEKFKRFMARVATQLKSLELSGTLIDNRILSIISDNGYNVQRIELAETHLLPEELLRFATQLRATQRFSSEPLEKIKLTKMYRLDEDSMAKLRDDLKRVCHIKLVTD